MRLQQTNSHAGSFYLLIFLPLAIILSSGLVGCSSTGEHIRAFQIAPANTNEIALLKVHRDMSFSAGVEKVDGIELNPGKRFAINNTREIELLAGRHDLEVSYQDSNKGYSISNAPISFVAVGGKTYVLNVAPLERTFGKGLHDSFFGGKYYWTVWIIDAETQQVVAGEPRTTPIHWYEK